MKDSQGVYQTDNEVIANLFNEYFALVFTKENNSTPEPRIRFEDAYDSVLNNIICSYEDEEKKPSQIILGCVFVQWGCVLWSSPA